MNDTPNAQTLPEPAATGGCRVRRMGIDTCSEHVVYLHSDSPVCRAEGFEPHSRVELRIGERSLLATLNVVHGAMLGIDEAGLSESAWIALAPSNDDLAFFAHPPIVDSLAAVRGKVYGKMLEPAQIDAIIHDIVHYRYSNIELAAFITACAGSHLGPSEVIALTGAMVKTGNRLHWNSPIVVDKHCIGGLAGNRTTPIVVAIVTALGLVCRCGLRCAAHRRLDSPTRARPADRRPGWRKRTMGAQRRRRDRCAVLDRDQAAAQRPRRVGCGARGRSLAIAHAGLAG